MGFRRPSCRLVKGCRPTWLSGKELAGGCASSCTFVSAAKRQSQTPNGACICRSCMREGQSEKRALDKCVAWVVAVRASSYLGTLQTPAGEASFAGSPFVPEYCHALACSNSVEPQYGSSRRSHRALPQNVTHRRTKKLMSSFFVRQLCADGSFGLIRQTLK